MSMLSRYRKSGGFIQLLILIETCDKAKQEKFLQMIEQEDPIWGRAIKSKMIDIHRVFSWSGEVLGEIMIRLPEIALAAASYGLTAEEWERASTTLSHSQKRKIQELRSAKQSTNAEIATAFNKILTEVRNMMTKGELRVEKFDPSLAIEDEIEEKLGHGHPSAGHSSSTSSANQSSNPQSSEANDLGKIHYLNDHMPEQEPTNVTLPTGVKELQQKLLLMNNENKKLKAELTTVKERLTQIKKLAS